MGEGGWHSGGVHGERCRCACNSELAALRRELQELKREARYYRAMHRKAVARESGLKETLKGLRTKVRELRQRLRERQARRRNKSEKRARSGNRGSGREAAAAPCPRGQQPGSRGHGRRDHSGLPAQVEEHELGPSATCWGKCGGAYRTAGSEDSEVLEVEVRAYRRVIKRQRYRRSCACAGWVAPGHRGGAAAALWREYVDRYHYLRYTPLAGAQMRYVVRSEPHTLAVLGFGASAWKVAPRDQFIGWSAAQREARLPLVVNNARFLILPWVQVRNLASWVLAHTCRRLPHDWQTRYGYRPLLLETFVQCDRFLGTSYRAANWFHVGQTQGRGKLDVHTRRALPKKNIWLHPLRRDFRRHLCAPLDPHPNQ